jgi:hypothetical protein
MAFFDFIENFFFISLGITFALILLLVYHFKQRISSMEKKGDTMYELITNVVKELQIMKKLNSYYETLFYGRESEAENEELYNEAPSCPFKKSSPENIQITLNDAVKKEKTPKPPGVDSGSSLINDKQIVVSDDSSVSSEDDTESEGSPLEPDLETLTDYDSDEYYEDENDDIKPVLLPENVEIPLSHNEVLPETVTPSTAAPIIPNDSRIVPLDEVEIKHENENDKVAVLSGEDNVLPYDGEPSIDITPIIQPSGPVPSIEEESIQLRYTNPLVLPPEELLPTEIQPLENNVSTVASIDVSGENVDKKQTREVYRKMNITQLRAMATSVGITVDTSKMKKNELIQLLENLEE